MKNEFNVYYDDSYLDLSKGDKLLFYTDGLVDAKNVENCRYGIDRLKVFLSNNSGLSGEELRNALKQDLYDYINGKKISDDITFFILEIV